MRASLLGVTFAVIGLSLGCVDPLPGSCEKDADCAAGQVCDLKAKACFVNQQCGSSPCSADKTSPTFAVDYEPAPALPDPDGGTSWTDDGDSTYATAFKRDGKLNVTVKSTDVDVDASSVKVTVSFKDGAPTTVPVEGQPASACGATSGYCGKAVVNLWVPEMNAFRADLNVVVKGADFAGNPSAEVSPLTAPKVTRWKWAHQVDSNPVKASPAIAHGGVVIAGSTNGAEAGALVALSSAGVLIWRNDSGAVTAAPAVGIKTPALQPVYVSIKDSIAGSLKAFDVATGTQIGSACLPTTTSTMNAAPTVNRTQYDTEPAALETATGIASGSGRIISLRPASGDYCMQTPATSSVNFPGNVVDFGGSIFFVDSNGYFKGFGFTVNNGWVTKFSPLGGYAAPVGIAAASASIVGARASGLFNVHTDGTAGSWSHDPGGSPGLPVVGTGDQVFVGVGNNSLLKISVGASTGTVASYSDSGTVQAAPLLGENGWLFVAGSDGIVQARRQDSIVSVAWSVDELGAIAASPNTDCSRDSDGTPIRGGPGVLYVGSDTGKLYSFIVDSRGIDVSAPWPKYQHDPRNTGNASTPLTEFICP